MNIQIDKVYRIVTQSLQGFVGMLKKHSTIRTYACHVNTSYASASKTDYGHGCETEKKIFYLRDTFAYFCRLN